MTILITVLSAVSILLMVLLTIQDRKNNKLVDENGRLKGRLGLLEEVRQTEQSSAGPEPLTVDKIAEAVRMEGYAPKVEKGWVSFKSQGEEIFVDANRLPLLFIIKGYGLDPADWEMDLLREAACTMSDEVVMVKAAFTDDEKGMRIYIAARDRNYESFRSNLTAYLSILEDGQRCMGEEYNRLLEKKREEALAVDPVLPAVQPGNKVLS